MWIDAQNAIIEVQKAIPNAYLVQNRINVKENNEIFGVDIESRFPKVRISGIIDALIFYRDHAGKPQQ